MELSGKQWRLRRKTKGSGLEKNKRGQQKGTDTFLIVETHLIFENMGTCLYT